MWFSPILTSEQAAFLYDLVQEHRAAIVARRSPGVCDGLLSSLSQIDRAGGVRLEDQPLAYGRNVVGAVIVPTKQYFAWLGIVPVPELFETIGTLPHLSYRATFWQPVSLCRPRDPVAILRLRAAALPLPLR